MTHDSLAVETASRLNLSLDDLRGALLGRGDFTRILLVRGDLDEATLATLRAWAAAPPASAPAPVSTFAPATAADRQRADLRARVAASNETRRVRASIEARRRWLDAGSGLTTPPNKPAA